jgi:hypothetical protein
MGLAHFYDDLYKVITLEQIGQRIDYKYDCYRRYLSARPLSEQQRAVQELGIRYYEQVVRLDPGNQDEARYLRELRQGSRDSGWFYCGD